MVLPLDQRGPLTGSPTAAATTVILASYVTTARRYAPTAQAVARWPGPWRDGPGRGEMDGVEAPQRSARSQRARSQNPAVLRYLVHPGVRRVDGKPVPGAPLAVAYRECQPDGRPGGPEGEESSCRRTSTYAPLVPSGWRRCRRSPTTQSPSARPAADGCARCSLRLVSSSRARASTSPTVGRPQRRPRLPRSPRPVATALAARTPPSPVARSRPMPPRMPSRPPRPRRPASQLTHPRPPPPRRRRRRAPEASSTPPAPFGASGAGGVDDA